MVLGSIKKTIKVIFIISLLVNLLFLSACVNHKTPPIPVEPDDKIVFPPEFLGFAANKKIYLTSFGQSKEVEDLNLFLFNLHSIDYIHDNQLEISEVEEGSIVLAVVGCSIKGLEAQNTSLMEEIGRCQTFTNAQKNDKITLITWHLGGMARRGSTSDEIISIALAESALSIFVTSGNEDAYLTTILKSHQVPFFPIANITQVTTPIQYPFSGEVGQ